MELRSRETLTVHRNGESVETKLDRIAERARRDKRAQFSSLSHLLNEETLKESFQRLARDAAPGIDRVTKDMYAEQLDENLADVVDRLKRRAYQPQMVRRKYIAKDGSSKMRPLGIPVTEDKLVQDGITRILERIYEQDFMDFSYGFRPERGCHDALKELNRIIMRQKVNYVVDADIRGFFDNVDHDWMMKFLRHRVTDTPMLQLIRRFLKAGILEDGQRRATEEGVPQGGTCSPLLANVYLHYTLDLWFDRVFARTCRGEAYLVRYADDFVACFQYKDDAERFYEALQVRLAKFKLEVAMEKTRIIAFGRFAAKQAKSEGKSKPDTFDFLGFTHYCGLSRSGRFCLKQRTSRKKARAKLKAFYAWLSENRHLPLTELWPLVNAKLRGHYQYYGITHNFACIRTFYYRVTVFCFKWLNRRGQKKSFTWPEFSRMLKRYPLAKPRICVPLYR